MVFLLGLGLLLPVEPEAAVFLQRGLLAVFRCAPAVVLAQPVARLGLPGHRNLRASQLAEWVFLGYRRRCRRQAFPAVARCRWGHCR